MTTSLIALDPDDPLAPLAARALGGDRAALEALCRSLQGPLFRLALRTLGSPADASDATQEVLLLVVTHLSQFRGESRLLTWAYAVATRHLLRSRARLQKERDVVQLEGSIKSGLAVTGPSSSPQGSEAEARLLTGETRLGCTQAMLACLSMEERMAVVLTELLGADDDLGARLCEVSPQTFRKRLSRGRARLRPVLEELCGLERSGAPCSCPRMARAKQVSGRRPSGLASLPQVEDAALQRAQEGFAQLRKLGPVFALEPLVGPPEDLWAELRRRLPAVLGDGTER
jgi:RNA polymerase sigma factor (sigma-70 family)